jgi:hypothetical protein
VRVTDGTKQVTARASQGVKVVIASALFLPSTNKLPLILTPPSSFYMASKKAVHEDIAQLPPYLSRHINLGFDLDDVAALISSIDTSHPTLPHLPAEVRNFRLLKSSRLMLQY